MPALSRGIVSEPVKFIFEHKPGTNPAIANYPPGECAAKQQRGESSLDDVVVILVVEDDQAIQSVIEESLGYGGFEITIASSGEQAVELLSAANPQFRAVVTDINLGRERMDGWDVARHARESKPDMPVVYMTGDSADEWASKGVPNSILLTKPFAPAQLVTAVAQLLNTGTPTA
jgi:CheY-like chemotaxis protein